MPLCKQKLDSGPVGETAEKKIVSNAYEHCKWLALELIHFMRGAADFKIQGFCATEELASSFTRGLDDDSFSG